MGADGIEGVWKFDTSGGQELGPCVQCRCICV